MLKNFFQPTEYNKILFESENFIVIPSLGSLVPGWLLIVPKRFSLNLAQLGVDELIELEVVATRCETELAKKYHSKIVRFEHGPSSNNSNVGCGVDYAHLHIVPIEINLIEGLNTYLNVQYEWIQLDSFMSIGSHSNDCDYLYYRDSDNKHYITSSESIPSQLFRRVIASHLQIPDAFDWKLFGHHGMIRDTISKLSPIEVF